jgi:hypothetical protein
VPPICELDDTLLALARASEPWPGVLYVGVVLVEQPAIVEVAVFYRSDRSVPYDPSKLSHVKRTIPPGERSEDSLAASL